MPTPRGSTYSVAPAPPPADAPPLFTPVEIVQDGKPMPQPPKPPLSVSPSGRRSSMKMSMRKSAAEPVPYEDLIQTMTGASSGSSPSSDLDPDVLKKDVSLLQERLAKIGRGLLNPRSKMMQYWDFATLSALFFTSTVTPYEVCLMWEESSFETLIADGGLPLFIANWIVNAIFIIDMGFNFFLPYKESVKKGGGTVKEHGKIARHYLYGWFPIDLISVIPFDNIMMGVDTSGIDNASIFSMIRMLRLLRLIKLARILRASRIFSRWENSIAISSANLELIRYGIMITMVVHWFSCTLGMMAQLMSPPRDDALADAIYDQVFVQGRTDCYGCMPDGSMQAGSLCRSPCLTDCEVEQLAWLQLPPNPYPEQYNQQVALLESNQNWVCRYSRIGKIRPPRWHGELWVAGLYVSMIQLGGGVGSIVPENFPEYVVFFVCILSGSVLWAMVVGTICATLATGDPHTIAFKQNMDQLNYFLEDMNMPQELRIRVREFLRNTKELSKKASYNELVSVLSPALRSEIVLMLSSRTLQVVWYLKAVEKGALVELALRLERAGYAPREKIASDKLTLLMRGVAAKAGNILTPVPTGNDLESTKGNLCTWGEDIVVTAPALRDRRPASALTFVEVATLSRPALDEVLASYPDSRKIIQQAAVKIAMQRAIVVVSEYMKLIKANRQSASQRDESGAALLETIHSRLVTGDTSYESEVHSGAQILQMMTGQPFREINTDEADAEHGASPPLSPARGGLHQSPSRGSLSSLPSEGLDDIKKQLTEEARKRADLANEVQSIKGSLAEVITLLKQATVVKTVEA